VKVARLPARNSTNNSALLSYPEATEMNQQEIERLVAQVIQEILPPLAVQKSGPFSLPIRELARREKISPTKLYRLADEGEIDTVADGKRRRVFVASWEQYLLRLKAEQGDGKFRLPSSNPKVKARQVAAAAAPSRGRRRGS